MASHRCTKGMRPAHAPKQTLFSSVEYGEGGQGKHIPVGEDWGGGQSIRHTKPLEQDVRTGAHHRYLFGHHYGNNISRKIKKKAIVLPTVRITESLQHRGPQYVHRTVTKLKRTWEIKWKIISVQKKKPLWYLECAFLYGRKLIGIVVNIG